MNLPVNQLPINGYYPYFDADKQTIVKNRFGKDCMLLMDASEKIYLVRIYAGEAEFVKEYIPDELGHYTLKACNL